MTLDSPQRSHAPPATEQRVIAFYHEGVDSQSAQAANAAVGATVVRALSIGDAAVLALPGDPDLEATLAQLRSQPGVAEASPDHGLNLIKR